jgi:hypothetical protein
MRKFLSVSVNTFIVCTFFSIVVIILLLELICKLSQPPKVSGKWELAMIAAKLQTDIIKEQFAELNPSRQMRRAQERANAKELDIKQRFLALQNQFNRTQRQQLDRIKARQSEPKSE